MIDIKKDLALAIQMTQYGNSTTAMMLLIEAINKQQAQLEQIQQLLKEINNEHI